MSNEKIIISICSENDELAEIIVPIYTEDDGRYEDPTFLADLERRALEEEVLSLVEKGVELG